MASNVLSDDYLRLAWLPERGGMNSAGLTVQRLPTPQRSDCLDDLGGVEANLVSRKSRNWAHRYFEALKPAKSTSCRAGHMSTSLRQSLASVPRQPNSQFQAGRLLDDVHRLDVGWVVDYAFAETEPDCEILQIRRRRHHDGVGRAIIAKRY